MCCTLVVSLLVLFFGLAGAVQAQELTGTEENGLLYQFGAKSPEASAIEKVGNVPVGLYTGTASVEIPLFTVEGTSLKLPISLKYHGSGIKVSQSPTQVGLGWSLNAGGSLTRQMKGRPDEIGWLRSKDQELYRKYMDGDMIDHRYGYDGGPETQQKDDGTYYRDYYFAGLQSAQWDSQPDRYTFSAAGTSGEFILTQDASQTAYENGYLSSNQSEIQTIPRGPTRIEKRSGDGWRVTGADGTAYVFDEIEMSQSTTEGVSGVSPNYTDGLDYPSAWHLGKIESTQDGDEITFTYATVDTSGQSSISESLTNEIKDNFNNCGGATSSSVSVTHSSSERVFVTTIRSAKHRVTFERTGPAGTQLSTIRVYNRTTDALIRQIDLQYGRLSTTDGSTGRRVLEKVTIHGGSNADEKVYTLGYNGTALPPYLSHARDRWGFYNGATSNGRGTGDCGDDTPCQIPDEAGLGSFFSGADRSPDPSYTKAGMLTEINYPTGGRTEIQYESNTFDETVKTYTSEDASILECHDRKYSSDPQCSDYSSSENIQYDRSPNVDSTTFSVSTGQYVTFDPGVESNTGDGECLTGDAYAEVRNTDSGKRIGYWDTTSPPEKTVYLMAGKSYTMEVSAWCGTSEIYARWDVQSGTKTVNRQGGGIRVAKVKKYPSDGAEPVVKTYSYTDDQGVSTGSLIGPPHDYTYTRKTRTRMKDGEETVCTTEIFSDYSGVYQLTSQGGHVAYRQVTVTRNDGSFVKHRFDVEGYSIPRDWPGATSSDASYLGGRKLASIQKKASGTTAARSRTSYEERDPALGVTEVQGINVLQDYSNRIESTVNGDDVIVKYDDYTAQPNYVRTSWVHPTSKITTKYDADGDSVWSKKVYTYESTDVTHFQPVEKEMRASNAPTKSQAFRYAHEHGVYDDGLEGMNPVGTNQVAARSRTDLRNADEEVVQRSWKKYTRPSGFDRWFVEEKWTWSGEPGTAPPSDYGGPETVRAKQILGFDAYGRPTRMVGARKDTVSFTYGGSGAPGSSSDPYRDAYLTSVEKGGLTSTFSWNADGQLSTRTSAAGTQRSFAYDELGRLTSVENSSGDVVMTHEYNYVGPGGSPGTSPNYVRKTAASSKNPDVVSTTYADGLGRTVQTHVRDGAEDVITHKTYDDLGRPKKTFRPYKSDVDHSFDTSGFTGKAKTVTRYQNDPRNRVDEVDPPEEGVVAKNYGIETVAAENFHGLSGTFQYVETIDEAGDTKRTYINAFGKKVAVVEGYGTPERAVTRFQYNAAGNLLRVVRPEGDVVTYEYDARGNLLQRTSPDMGN